MVLSPAIATLGFLVVARWPSQAASRPATNGRLVVTERVIDRSEAEHEKLQNEIDVRRSDADARQQRAACNASAAGGLDAALAEQRALAGILPPQGRGIVLLLDDSDVSAVPASEDPNNYIVHGYQIRDVDSLLFCSASGGARALRQEDGVRRLVLPKRPEPRPCRIAAQVPGATAP